MRALPCFGCGVEYFTDDMINRRCMNCYSIWITALRGDERYYPPTWACSRCGERRYVKDGNFRELCAQCATVAKRWNLTLRVCKGCKRRFRNKFRHVNYCNDLGCAASRRREARMVLVRAKGTHTAEEWETLLEFHGGICVYCQAAPATAKDHIVPVSRGGSDSIRNIAPTCKPCNSAKSNKLLSEWKPVA